MLAAWAVMTDHCMSWEEVYGQARKARLSMPVSLFSQDAKFVEERRKQLQNYLRNVMNKVIQMVPEFATNPKKETLIQLMPFFV